MSIEQLSKESETTVLYQDFLSALNTAMRNMRKENSTVECPAIFWMQGEFNYDPNPDKGLYPGVPNTTSKNGYKELLIKLKNNMQDDVVRKYGQSYRPVLITYQTGAQYVRDSLSISMAQVEAANEYDDIYCAGPVYQMPDRGGHLDPNGYRWYGEMLGKVYQQVVVEKKGLQAAAARPDKARQQGEPGHSEIPRALSAAEVRHQPAARNTELRLCSVHGSLQQQAARGHIKRGNHRRRRGDNHLQQLARRQGAAHHVRKQQRQLG